MTAYQVLLVLKFLGVLGFAGGAITAFLAGDTATRRSAVHRVASPCLLATWVFGYVLLALNGWPMFEFWIVAAIFLSLIANGLLAYCVARDRRSLQAFLWSAAPVVVIVVLMVRKPTWEQVLP
jgi:hypothetical protein